MLPPVDEGVLRDNPDFAKLYATLTTSILNPDGSTKADPAAEQRAAVREELKAHRLKATRQHLLREAIASAVPDPPPPAAQQPPHRRSKSRPQQVHQIQQQQPPLPAELLDLLLLLPPLLAQAATLPRRDLALLLSRPPFATALLPSAPHFARLAALVSASLVARATALARVLHPHTNPSYVHRLIPALPAAAADQAARLAAASRHLRLVARPACAAALARLLRYNNNGPRGRARLLRVLEAKHGGTGGPGDQKRAERCAARLALDAGERAAAAVALHAVALAAVYPPRAVAALQAYRAHLRGARTRLQDGIRVRRAELRDYGVDVDADAGEEGTGEGEGEGRGDEHKWDGGGDGDGEDDNKDDRRTLERTLREMARVKREMEARLAEVQADLDRLG
ncbi:hypothetical protein GGR56DRAFT_679434 [Xylariaceae sp. FL0804]|nr:hypothetical protein GGR56DRAFT_679434 [Xylariaceae sp. FL0804]